MTAKKKQCPMCKTYCQFGSFKGRGRYWELLSISVDRGYLTIGMHEEDVQGGFCHEVSVPIKKFLKHLINKDAIKECIHRANTEWDYNPMSKQFAKDLAEDIIRTLERSVGK